MNLVLNFVVFSWDIVEISSPSYSVKVLLSEANMSFTHAGASFHNGNSFSTPIASQISKGPFSHPKPAFIASSILYSSSDISEFG
jgi:hypothetical protein